MRSSFTAGRASSAICSRFLRYERLLKHVGVRVISITQQTADDPAGEMASKLFSLFDDYQSKENGKRTPARDAGERPAGLLQRFRSALRLPGVATDTVGNRGRSKRRLELDPLEAETVREIYRLYLAGHDGQVLGMKAIATYLNRQGLTMRGRPWRIQKVNRLLAGAPALCRLLLFQPTRLADAPGTPAARVDRRLRPHHHRRRHLRAHSKTPGKLRPEGRITPGRILPCPTRGLASNVATAGLA